MTQSRLGVVQALVLVHHLLEHVVQLLMLHLLTLILHHHQVWALVVWYMGQPWQLGH